VTTSSQQHTAATAAGCPVTHTDYRIERPIFGHYEQLNLEREQSDFLLNDSTNTPFYMIQRYDHVLEALQQPDLFSNDIVNALDPFMEVRFLPNNLNPPDHTRMRKVLNRWFSPAAVRRIEPEVVARCRELIDELAPRGGCDVVSEFAIRFPTEMFLLTIGLPVADGEKFTEWVEALFAGFFGGPDPVPAMNAIVGYFKDAIAERKANPRDPETDFISRMLRQDLVGDFVTEDDLLVICMTLMTAGLDTTRAALGYILQHLAGDAELRHRLTAQPELFPRAIEEFMRLYPLVIQDGRLVMRDVDFHGLHLKKGDVLWLGIGSANRDPHKFPNPDSFDMDRPDLNHHLGFAAGPHRCLGMHLARHELVVALQEWHRRIPDYEIAPGSELRERGGQLTLVKLPLQWTPDVGPT
jgi:cytochrome P450